MCVFLMAFLSVSFKRVMFWKPVPYLLKVIQFGRGGSQTPVIEKDLPVVTSICCPVLSKCLTASARKIWLNFNWNKNENVFVVPGNLHWTLLSTFKRKICDRYITCGIALKMPAFSQITVAVGIHTFLTFTLSFMTSSCYATAVVKHG